MPMTGSIGMLMQSPEDFLGDMQTDVHFAPGITLCDKHKQLVVFMSC